MMPDNAAKGNPGRAGGPDSVRAGHWSGWRWKLAELVGMLTIHAALAWWK
ncbi:MAG TPA: hypothetical protein VD866_04545 [Urbifossiella sp.]|nr:hypothetical protein [Urbifossiella sp.]